MQEMENTAFICVLFQKLLDARREMQKLIKLIVFACLKLEVIGAILIGFCTFLYLQATLFHIKWIKFSIYANSSSTFKITLKVLSQLVPCVQKLAILATFLSYHNNPTLWGYLDTPICSNENRYISYIRVSSMITTFSIMSSIFKTWTMDNA